MNLEEYINVNIIAFEKWYIRNLDLEFEDWEYVLKDFAIGLFQFSEFSLNSIVPSLYSSIYMRPRIKYGALKPIGQGYNATEFNQMFYRWYSEYQNRETNREIAVSRKIMSTTILSKMR